MEVGISEVAAEGVEESESKQMECPNDRSPGGWWREHPSCPPLWWPAPESLLPFILKPSRPGSFRGPRKVLR